jgi:hypothetical protein
MVTTKDAGQITSTKGQLQRRGVMTGVAALVGAGLAKMLGAGRADAGHDGTNPWHLGAGDNLFGTARLRITAPETPALYVANNGTGFGDAIIGEIPAGGSANAAGVYGRSAAGGVGVLGAGSRWGVWGTHGGNFLSKPNAGVHGESGLEIGVLGTSAANTGVYGISGSTGPNLTVAGVTGTSTSKIGVLGTSNTESGLVGVSGGGGPGTTVAGAVGTSTTRIGVLGTSSSNTGVQGLSTSGHGVFGQTSAPAGTVVNGMLAAGLAGRTGSTIALYGYSDGPANASYAPVGAVGQCENGFGLWGLSSAGPGATSRPGGGAPTAVSGVLGTSTSNVGVYAISSGSYALAADGNGPNTVGVLGRGLGGGRAAVFVGNVEVQGHLTVTGGINGPTGAQAAIEDFGEGQLTAGRAEVRLDPAVAAALPDDRYLVFLTENDDHHGLYVTRRTRQGFEVRAKEIPTASGTFSYRIVARRRAEQRPGDAVHTPSLPVPQGVPTLPVGPAAPPPTSTPVPSPAPAPVPAPSPRDPRPASPR